MTCSSQLGHAHLVVHRHRDGEVLLGLTGIAHAVMHLAETEVTVGNERMHGAGLGERQRLAVVPAALSSSASTPAADLAAGHS